MGSWIYTTILFVVLLFAGITAEEYTHQDEDDEPCYPHACEFGECVPEGKSFRCECRNDHVGETCNIWRSSLVNCDVDGPLKCFNGGLCNTTKNSFTCVCPPNFTGFFCEEDVDECESTPCHNGGTCVNRAGSFFCLCPLGFKGKTCEQPVETCSPDTCKNAGTCMNAVEGFVCLCPLGFTGQRCDELKDGLVWNKEISRTDIGKCAACDKKAGNGHCDLECDLLECNHDGGDCLYKNPFHACPNATFCTLAFHNGVCNEICDNELCLFDGFDCVLKKPICPHAISPYCKAHKGDGICEEECNQEGCDYDGGDCNGISAKILSGELSIVVLTDPSYFVANTARFLQSLNKILRARVRIKRDKKGTMLFMWHDGRMGDRVKMENLGFTSFPTRSSKDGVIVFIEVDISGCVTECFTDVEVVANFIDAAKEKLTGMNMSIYSVDAKKPGGFKRGLDITLVVLLGCVVLMITIVIVFMIHQKPKRKRKVVENAPVWIPPTEQEVEKANHNNASKWKQRILLENAKRRRIDSSNMKLLEEQLTPHNSTMSRVFVKPKGSKAEPIPSRLHIEAASADPITIPIAAEDVNRRGSIGRIPVMELVRNLKKTEEQVLEDLTRLRSAGADLNLWDDTDDTALHMAVSSGRVRLVEKLLQLGASPIIRDRKNSTCLHLAARMCAFDMVKLLLKNEEMKSEVDAVDDDNRTALMLVAMHDRVDTRIAELLCQAGANVNYDGDNVLNTWTGRTALHFAAKYDNTQMVTFLLSQGANKDCQDHECCTPLHLAASEGHEGPAKELIKVGASVMLRNDKSQTPYDTALVNNRERVAALLASGDNLRVQLYSNNGEIFASSTPPGFKCAKLLMARHTRSVRVAASQSSRASPRSAQSTPTRHTYNAASPYSTLSTPHSVITTYLSPQFSTTPGSMHPSYASSGDVQPIIYSAPQPIVEMQQPTVNSPHQSDSCACYAQAEKSVSVHSTYMDSGFGTFLNSSHYENNASWRSNGKIYADALSPHQQRQCLEGFIV